MKVTALNLSDASAMRAWLDDLAARVDDVAAVAADQTAPVADRKLVSPAGSEGTNIADITGDQAPENNCAASAP